MIAQQLFISLISTFPSHLISSCLLKRAPLGKVHALRRSIVAKPAHTLSSTLIHQTTRQLPALFGLENAFENLLLARACANKRYARGVLHDRKGERNALGRRLGRVLDAEHPGVRLAKLRVAGEKTASVSVRSTAEEQQVEERQFDAVARGEDGDESLFVSVGGFLRVVEQVLVDGEDFGLSQFGRDFGEEFFLDQLVVGVFVGEGHAALVGVEDFPLAEVRAVVFVTRTGCQEGFGEDFGQRAAGDGDAECVVALFGFGLGFEDVFAQVGREVFVDVREGVEVYGAASHVCGWECECEVGVRIYFKVAVWAQREVKCQDERGRRRRERHVT
jgi:hypothetical protein